MLSNHEQDTSALHGRSSPRFLSLPEAFASDADYVEALKAHHAVINLDTISDKACPNEYEPSDHLPVCAVFLPRR